MKYLLQVLMIARLEARFFIRYPKLLLAALGVALIPALYAVIYLSSVWDPAARTGALPVAIVNLDQGLEYRQHRFNVGQEVAAKLRARHTFGYIDEHDEQAARQRVRQGALAFALIIPPDFSSNAIPGAQAGAGKLVIYTSEGNSYQGAALARRFAEDLGREVNGSLNEQRWELVLSETAGSQSSLARLHDGVSQLRLGARQLANGSGQTAHGAESLAKGSVKLDKAVTQLTTGAKELGAGIRTLDGKRPRNTELSALSEGFDALTAGQGELGRGLGELQTGTQSLKAGVAGFREEADGNLLVGASITQGLDKIGSGVSELQLGLQSAAAAQDRLSEGTRQLGTGVTTLTTGVRAMNAGIHTAAAKLPDDAQLDELAKAAGSLTAGTSAVTLGAQKVNDAARYLAGGMDLLAESLPMAGKKLEGSAQGLANSVQPVMELAAAVQNNGSSFAPNIIPGALWLGASLAVFLIQVRVLPRQALFVARPLQVLGKVLWPAGVVLAQALLVFLAVLFVLKIHVAQAGALAMTLGVAALTFLLIVFALTRALGDAGKALALILLAVQLSSSGGVLPVELSGGLFAQISPWLPITWVVKAIKASMFGAYDGQWQSSLWLVALAGLLAALMACLIGRWRFVRSSALRPVLDF